MELVYLKVILQFPALESMRQLAGPRRRVVRQLSAGASLPVSLGSTSG